MFFFVSLSVFCDEPGSVSAESITCTQRPRREVWDYRVLSEG